MAPEVSHSLLRIMRLCCPVWIHTLGAQIVLTLHYQDESLHNSGTGLAISLLSLNNLCLPFS